ncbi:MAG: hypothetical protein J5518_06300 [Lachnospiraceae bacterium]|nr:hypothetical protein [Lachnospiraceae bacterium]
MQIKQMRQEVEEEIARLEKLDKQIPGKLKGLPPGKLNCKVRKGGYQYYMNGVYQRVNSDAPMTGIANREYLEKLQQAVREKLLKLKKMKQCCAYDFDKPELVYANLHPARKRLVNPLILPKEDYIKRWQEEPYEHWEIGDDDVRGTIITDRGERVRSKSEKIIADALYRQGIPYKYEYLLELKRGKQIVRVRPDFLTLSLKTMEEVVIEHLGMMDDEQYYLRSMDKIDLYEKNGYLIGEKLILLHETMNNPLDTTIMRRYIETFLV